jgi:hypothetical protein
MNPGNRGESFRAADDRLPPGPDKMVYRFSRPRIHSSSDPKAKARIWRRCPPNSISQFARWIKLECTPLVAERREIQSLGLVPQARLPQELKRTSYEGFR